MKEWKYKIYEMESVGFDSQREKLNALGEKGWELVSVQPYIIDLPVFYLKKPKKKDD